MLSKKQLETVLADLSRVRKHDDLPLYGAVFDVEDPHTD